MHHDGSRIGMVVVGGVDGGGGEAADVTMAESGLCVANAHLSFEPGRILCSSTRREKPSGTLNRYCIHTQHSVQQSEHHLEI